MIFFSLCSTTLPQMWVQLWKLTEYSNKSQFSNQRTEKQCRESEKYGEDLNTSVVKALGSKFGMYMS